MDNIVNSDLIDRHSGRRLLPLYYNLIGYRMMRHPVPSDISNFNGKSLQIFVVRNVGIDTFSDDFLALLSILLTPFLVFHFNGLGFIHLPKIHRSVRFQIDASHSCKLK